MLERFLSTLKYSTFCAICEISHFLSHIMTRVSTRIPKQVLYLDKAPELKVLVLQTISPLSFTSPEISSHTKPTFGWRERWNGKSGQSDKVDGFFIRCIPHLSLFLITDWRASSRCLSSVLALMRLCFSLHILCQCHPHISKSNLARGSHFCTRVARRHAHLQNLISCVSWLWKAEIKTPFFWINFQVESRAEGILLWLALLSTAFSFSVWTYVFKPPNRFCQLF